MYLTCRLRQQPNMQRLGSNSYTQKKKLVSGSQKDSAGDRRPGACLETNHVEILTAFQLHTFRSLCILVAMRPQSPWAPWSWLCRTSKPWMNWTCERVYRAIHIQRRTSHVQQNSSDQSVFVVSESSTIPAHAGVVVSAEARQRPIVCVRACAHLDAFATFAFAHPSSQGLALADCDTDIS